MVPESSLRWVRVSGVSFAVLFTIALTIGLGDLVGAFADAGTSFPAFFDQRVERVRHSGATYLLVGSGFAFAMFAVTLSRASIGGSGAALKVAVVVMAGVFTTLVCVAAAALATVSMSIGFGTITGDPGIRQGQDLLPQLGYVLLTVPSALAGGVTVWLLAGSAGRVHVLPRPLVIAGQLTALAQLFAFYSLPMVLLPLWVLLASLAARSPRHVSAST